MSPIVYLIQQPLFLVFLMLVILDGVWIQFNSQLIDFDIDQKGDQRTTSVVLGKQFSILLLRGIICSMLASMTIYLILNDSSKDFLPDYVILISILVSILLIILYLFRSLELENNFEMIRIHSAWVRRKFVYAFGIIGILLIN